MSSDKGSELLARAGLIAVIVALVFAAGRCSLAHAEDAQQSDITREMMRPQPVVLMLQYEVTGRPIMHAYLTGSYQDCYEVIAKQVPAPGSRGAPDQVVCVSAAAWVGSGEALPTARYVAGSP